MFDDGEEKTTGGSEREGMEDVDVGDSPWKPLKAAAQQRRTKTETEKFPGSSLPVSWQDEATFWCSDGCLLGYQRGELVSQRRGRGWRRFFFYLTSNRTNTVGDQLKGRKPRIHSFPMGKPLIS